MKPSEIIQMARDYPRYWHTNDPYVIAERFGIYVIHRTPAFKDFTAQIIKTGEKNPMIISINDDYTDFSKMILCAHELGHALLHQNCVNYFSATGHNQHASVEYEANLFALALLTDETFDQALPISLENMNNYLLKTIIDYNLQKKIPADN